MNNRTAVLLLVVPLMLSATSTRAEIAVEKTDLFRAGEGGYAVYRIPGIVATGGHVVLVYCEARKNGAGDWGQIDVLMRRSTDSGRTWEPPRKIVRAPADAKPNPVAPRRIVDGIAVNNPVAISDPGGDTVHFLYCVEYSRCFYMRSEDRGNTFTNPVEITATFDRFRPEYDWKVIATGPGHGIRLRDGRLVVPVWLSTSKDGPHHPSSVATIYSDDDGKSWHRGDVVVGDPVLYDPSEAAVAELSDGSVMLNIRHENKFGDAAVGEYRGFASRRAVTVSADGARHWSRIHTDNALPDPVCMASMVQSPSGLLFCNPDNSKNRDRKNLTLKVSRDDGKTWAVARRIEPGASGYSDLAALPDGTIYCFYERGAPSPAALCFARLRLEP